MISKVRMVGRWLLKAFVRLWWQIEKYDLAPGPTREVRRTQTVARYLSTLNGVQGVEVFGNIARQGHGHDIDLIVLVDDWTACGFVQAMSEFEGDAYASSERLWIAGHLLGEDVYDEICRLGWDVSPKEWGGLFTTDLYQQRTLIPVDIFLLPVDWRTNIWLQEELPSIDPDFLTNIATDAMRVGGSEFNRMRRRWLSKYCRAYARIRGDLLFWRMLRGIRRRSSQAIKNDAIA